MAITQYNINPVAHGVNGFGLQFSDTSYSVLLTADTDTTLTVPGAQATGAQSTVYAKFYAIMKYSTDGIANYTQSSFTSVSYLTESGGLITLGNFTGLTATRPVAINPSLNGNGLTFDAELY